MLGVVVGVGSPWLFGGLSISNPPPPVQFVGGLAVHLGILRPLLGVAKISRMGRRYVCCCLLWRIVTILLLIIESHRWALGFVGIVHHMRWEPQSQGFGVH